MLPEWPAAHRCLHSLRPGTARSGQACSRPTRASAARSGRPLVGRGSKLAAPSSLTKSRPVANSKA